VEPFAALAERLLDRAVRAGDEPVERHRDVERQLCHPLDLRPRSVTELIGRRVDFERKQAHIYATVSSRQEWRGS
jgi:hypothetical protein